MINAIVSDPHRLRAIALQGHSSCIEPFLNLPAGLAKSLEFVTVIVRRIGSIDLSMLKGSTKLRQLTTNMIPPYSSIVQLPLTQLTVLRLPCSRLHPRAALSILRQCPSLIHCTLRLTNDGDDAPPDATPCLLPKLTHLDLLPWSRARFDYLPCIESLVLPRLTHLYLTYFHTVPQLPAACYQRITQSGTLLTLKIDIPMSSPHLEELLRASPFLIDLFMPRSAFSPWALEGVALGALLPKVRNLTCMIGILGGFYSHLDMLVRRKLCLHATHIAEMTFMTKSSFNESQMRGSARYEEMVRLGWKIGVMTYR